MNEVLQKWMREIEEEAFKELTSTELTIKNVILIKNRVKFVILKCLDIFAPLKK